MDTAAKQPHAERVEGADGHRLGLLLRHHAADAFAHFRGGLVGEGHREDVLRRDPHLQHVRDPAGHRAGLARAGPGQNEDRAVERGHGVPLGLVEGIE